jgi:hypothetical protein
MTIGAVLEPLAALLPSLIVREWTYRLSAFRHVLHKPERSEPGGRAY